MIIKHKSVCVLKREKDKYDIKPDEEEMVQVTLGDKQKEFFTNGLREAGIYEMSYDDETMTTTYARAIKSGEQLGTKGISMQDLDKKLDKIFEAVLENNK